MFERCDLVFQFAKLVQLKLMFERCDLAFQFAKLVQLLLSIFFSH